MDCKHKTFLIVFFCNKLQVPAGAATRITHIVVLNQCCGVWSRVFHSVSCVVTA